MSKIDVRKRSMWKTRWITEKKICQNNRDRKKTEKKRENLETVEFPKIKKLKNKRKITKKSKKIQ